jgi:hypothetical protein
MKKKIHLAGAGLLAFQNPPTQTHSRAREQCRGEDEHDKRGESAGAHRHGQYLQRGRKSSPRQSIRRRHRRERSEIPGEGRRVGIWQGDPSLTDAFPAASARDLDFGGGFHGCRLQLGGSVVRRGQKTRGVRDRLVVWFSLVEKSVQNTQVAWVLTKLWPYLQDSTIHQSHWLFLR